MLPKVNFGSFEIGTGIFEQTYGDVTIVAE